MIILYVVLGNVKINDFILTEGDGLSFIDENKLEIKIITECEIILFDLV